MDKNERKQFACYISRLREKQNVTMNQLCEGLCSDRAAMFIEQGNRDTARPLREALLERLGVGAEDYESYLGCKEHARWQRQQQIMHYITYGENLQAEELLEKYWEVYCVNEENSGKGE